jgi:DNA-binding transcriptional MocR family regulator
LDWRTLICCSGAQNAMAIAFAALCEPGDGVLCEAASFSGAKALASQLRLKLHGVAMDAQGAQPESLDRAAKATGARLLYLVPTLQNPTGRTMDPKRRADIVTIARARNLWIVEDDIYAPYARHLDFPPIASMAPERTLYVSSLSKVLSPGLRAGFLIAPAGELFDRCVRTMRALIHSPSGIGTAIATDWFESGRADQLARDAVAETQARTAMTLAAMQGAVEQPQTSNSLHLWLPMPEAEAQRVVTGASSAGLRLSAPGAFAISDASPVSGVRLCIGSAANRATLERALSILTGVLKGEVNGQTEPVL